MTEAEAKPGRDRQFTAVLALLLTAAACAILVLSTPRALVPSDLPPLVLDPERVAQAIARDGALAPQAPGGKDVDELEARYLEEGLAERGAPEEMGDARARQYGMRELAGRVFARVGPQGVQALRASGLLRFLRALHGDTRDQHEAAGVQGRFPDMLREYGLLDAQSRLVAPELSLRAMAKARWNLVHGLSASAGLTTIEVQAFEGFVAMHAGAAPKDRRLLAARAFFMAGGHRSTQVYATWLSHGGRSKEGLLLMQRARTLRPEIRTRNYTIGIAASAM